MSKLDVYETSGDFTHVVKLDYLQLIQIAAGTNPFNGDALATAGQLPIASIPAGGAVDLVYVDELVAFVGTTSLVIDIGTTGADPDEFINALDVDAMTVPVFNTGDLMVKSAATTTFLGGALPVSAVSADTDIILEITDASIASATAGELLIGFKIFDIRRFQN